MASRATFGNAFGTRRRPVHHSLEEEVPQKNGGWHRLVKTFPNSDLNPLGNIGGNVQFDVENTTAVDNQIWWTNGLLTTPLMIRDFTKAHFTNLVLRWFGRQKRSNWWVLSTSWLPSYAEAAWRVTPAS